MVEADVEERIAAYQAAKREHPERGGFARIIGSFQYGAADDSRADQVQHGLRYHQQERQHQREIRERISALRRANSLDFPWRVGQATTLIRASARKMLAARFRSDTESRLHSQPAFQAA
jgi:hypothetical protein